MNELEYNMLVEVIEQMINDKVQLLHGGQIFDWADTKIPEILEKIKQMPEEETLVKSGTLLVNKYSGQKCAVINDNGEKVNMIIQGDILTYPKKWLWYHFAVSKPRE